MDYHVLMGAGQIAGLVGFILMFFQFVFSSRVRWLEKDIGLDTMYRYHKQLGIIAFVLIFLHPLFLNTHRMMVIGEMEEPSLFIGLGFIALAILIITSMTAIFYKRLRLRYETWFTIHKANYLVFPLVFFHSIKEGTTIFSTTHVRYLWYVLFALYLLLVIYKIVQVVRARRHPYQIIEIIKETPDIHTVVLQGKKKHHLAGQFMFLQICTNQKVSEAHPFTISSSPTEENLKVSVKALGDFTSQLPNVPIGTKAYIDGPYGVFTLQHMPSTCYVLIAGGIGITPFISMLRKLHAESSNKKILLLWCNKTEQDIAFCKELEELELSMEHLRVIHILSQQPDWHGETGYLTSDKLRTYCAEYTHAHFLICGPPGMLQMVRKELQLMDIPSTHIHYEKFEL
ncbi:hypothetical protein BHU72_14900 [Desulfuribacillus stibiiarsenatis]|uniref:FAD-binding FR-type domain-containing protein n=1 Tax=Desulfuribacillus stibiiarsenatis TaxID=1390249 RepID=A0A1E5L784_9FIRM|nr:ferric reductase-like transmembrane domain-containing protein [Desulfuribacillus stibiiarsenatis]OEH85991.1 hypothetical protein BHU72_14900 [Desulfuribacillus stibiiarsenatis]